MDRITRKVGDGVVFPSELVGVCMEPSNPTMYKILTRLAEYEDTGLTPDEVEQLIIFEMAKAVAEITEFDGVPIQRLKELAVAEKSGEIETLRHGHWMYKYKVRDGIQHHTGEDIWGNVYTIQCDERYEINEPYCSECHKLNDGSSLDWCPNCGAKMDKEAEYARVKALPLSVGSKMDGGRKS